MSGKAKWFRDCVLATPRRGHAILYGSVTITNASALYEHFGESPIGYQDISPFTFPEKPCQDINWIKMAFRLQKLGAYNAARYTEGVTEIEDLINVNPIL